MEFLLMQFRRDSDVRMANKKLTWAQFYKTLRTKGMSEARIKGLWADYAVSGKIPMPNWDNSRLGEQQSTGINYDAPTRSGSSGDFGPDRAQIDYGQPYTDNRSQIDYNAPWRGSSNGNSNTSGSPILNGNLPFSRSLPGGNPSGNGWEPSRNGKFSGAVSPRLGEQHGTGGGNIQEVQRKGNLTRKANDFGLGDLLNNLNSAYSAPPDFQYQDFSSQANDIAAKNFSPQYEALTLAQQNAQSQYNTADPIIKGLYEKLGNETRASAQATGAETAQDVSARGQVGSDLASTIAGTYGSTQQNQADLLQKLGIQDAGPATLQAGTDNSAWQQGQANIGTQQQKDYIQNTGQNQQNYQNSVATAVDTQGAVSREGLISELANALSQIDAQRLGVASNQSQSATDLGMRLSDRNYQSQQDNYSATNNYQKDALDRMIQGYQLKLGANDATYARKQDYLGGLAAGEQQQYDRGKDFASFELEVKKAETAAAAAAAKQNVGLPVGDQGAIQAAYTRMAPYGAEGAAALTIAQQVAAGAGNPNNQDAPKSRAEFISQVINAGQAQQPPLGQEALLEAANQLAEIMGYGKTPVQ